MDRFATHEVLNQPPSLEGLDLFSSDRVLVEAVGREGGGAWSDSLAALGRELGRPESFRLGEAANRNPPLLRTHDRYGRRIDEVEFHPAWHDLLALAIGARAHALPWVERRPGGHVARAATCFLIGQVESGVLCPVAMTFAAPAALVAAPDLDRVWRPKIVADRYDPTLRPVADKPGALIGMAITEKQGGSDVRANTTRAEPAGDGGYLLTGHKWFCSAPMSDGFLTLAQAPAGPTCFVLPRVLPDGSRNAFHIQRLKDKLGNRSNASAEIEYAGAYAWPVGEPGHGIRIIIRMVHHTRLDCTIGSAALIRQAVAQALHHAVHRTAFQRRLVDQPLMRRVLADLAVESEAATVLTTRLARAFDEATGDPRAAAFARIATAIAKYWICKRAPPVVAEALECLGGNGYVEESILPRLYREAPVNGIWEGSGNVICLDVLRALRSEEARSALLAELRAASGADPTYDAWLMRLEAELADPDDAEARARDLVERLALALQASLLLRVGGPVADAFAATRLGSNSGRHFGAFREMGDAEPIIRRAMPNLR